MSLHFAHRLDLKIRSGLRFRDNLRWMMFPEFPFVRVFLANTLALTLLGLALPLFVQMVTNNLVSVGQTQPLVVLVGLLTVILSFSGVIQSLQTYTVEILRRRLFVRLMYVIGERMTNYRHASFAPHNSPALVNRCFDLFLMQSSLVNFFVEGMGFLIMFVIGFSLLAFYHPYFLGFALFIAIFLCAIWMLFGPDGVRAGSPEADGRYNAIGWLEELSRARNVFTSETGRRFSIEKTTDLFDKWLAKRNILFGYQFRQHVALQVFSAVTNVLFLYVGGSLVLRRELSIGQLVAATLVVGNIIASLPRLQTFFTAVYEFSTSIDMIARFYDHPLEPERDELPAADGYGLTYREVRVAPNYHFDITIEEGSKVAVFVRSLSSVDVFYELLVGFTEPERGGVFVGGYHLQNINLPRLRDDVQLIRMDQYFAGTIRENLCALAPRPIGIGDVQSALEQLGLLELVQSLPKGLETALAPNGYPLSMPEILGLQVARALVAKPKILVIGADFERVPLDRRQVVRLLIERLPGSTILFFTQRNYDARFDAYAVIDRQGFRKLEDRAEFATLESQYA